MNAPQQMNAGQQFNPHMATPEEIAEKIRILNEPLNPGQRRAAETTEGPVMIVAGAGAGKTKTLIHRIATMMLKGVPAANILAVTFTNRAASEIKERLEGMVGENGQYVHAGTFHSIIFREILKRHSDSEYLQKIGVDMGECAILDDKDAQQLLKDAMGDLSETDARILEEEEWKVGDFEKIMSAERALGHDVFDFYSRIAPGSRSEVRDRLVAQVWQNYNKRCRDANGMDFDDILVHADKMLKRETHIADELSKIFRYIMLDEYQDTNPVQMSIMDSIAKFHNNICTVGDEKQSIYKFRGADIGVILSFQKRFTNAVMVELNENYRSYSEVIRYSNALADAMGEKLSDGQLIARRKVEEDNVTLSKRRSNSVAMVEFPNEEAEAEAVRKAIFRDLALGVKGKDIAVLYRNRNLKNTLERELVKHDLAYTVYGDKSFFQKAEVRDAIALTRFVFNPWDSVAGFRVLKATSMKISDQAAKKAMKEEGINAFEYLRQQSQKRLKAKKKGEDQPALTAAAQRVGPFVEISTMIKESAEFGDNPTFIRDALARLWDIYMRPKIEAKATKQKNGESEAQVDNRLENVQHIFNRVKDSLEKDMPVSEIIEDLQMMVDNNADSSTDTEDKIQLMTMHASKGLEFHNVYSIGLDNITTHGEEPTPDETEESRRLVYVAMTRAEKKLTMSYSQSRLHNGKYINVTGSPFFDEIESRVGVKRFVVQPKSHEAASLAR